MALRRLKARSVNLEEDVKIELNQDYVVFQGSEHEALAVYLSGHLSFRLREAICVKSIRLHLTGVRQASTPIRTTWKKPSSEDEFYRQTWEFHDAYRTTPEIFPVGDYKYPFNVVIEGSMPETVEGLKDASIAYTFTLEIGRKSGKDIRFQRPLRIIRMPQLYTQDVTLDEVWADKIAYRIHVPHRAVAFGTSFDVDYSLTPVLKDLHIEHVEAQLLEITEFTLNEGDMVDDSHCTTTMLASDRYIFDDDTAEYGTGAAEEYDFSRSLRLPRELGHCVQDTDAMGLRVKHKLNIQVRMENPDGHLSELRLSIPVSIYLSPYHASWEDSFDGEAIPREILNADEEAPPAYERHELDAVYNPQ
ncbi:hypothetical protein BJX76DRAFT_288060 [Aspergillus varians]